MLSAFSLAEIKTMEGVKLFFIKVYEGEENKSV